MSDQLTPPQPTERDLRNAANREEIARRQNEAWGKVHAWALGKFGPGYEPSGCHFLLDKAEEDAARTEGRSPVVAAAVYCVKNRTGRCRYFSVEDGRVTEHPSAEAAFGPKLEEIHPTLTFPHRGEQLPALRYSLCWKPIERYEPMTALELARLRESRERGKAERATKKWVDDHPLLAQAGIRPEDLEDDKGRGR